jgi:hypothetical protein
VTSQDACGCAAANLYTDKQGALFPRLNRSVTLARQ